MNHRDFRACVMYSLLLNLKLLSVSIDWRIYLNKVRVAQVIFLWTIVNYYFVTHKVDCSVGSINTRFVVYPGVCAPV